MLCREMRLSSDVDLRQVARLTPGFVGADLQALTREAALSAVNRQAAILILTLLIILFTESYKRFKTSPPTAVSSSPAWTNTTWMMSRTCSFTRSHL